MHVDRKHFRFGSRFTFFGSEYDVGHVEDDTIRYMACKGGRQYTSDISKLLSQAGDGKLAFTYVALCRSSDQSLTLATMTDSERDAAARVEAYVTRLKGEFGGWRWPKVSAMRVIKAVAEARNEMAPDYSTVARWRERAIKRGFKPEDLAPDFRKCGRNSPFSEAGERAIRAAIKTCYETDERQGAEAVRSALIGELLENGKLREVFPKRVPSLRTIERRIQETDSYQRHKSRHGAKAADRAFRAAGEGVWATRILEVTQADGQLLDIEVYPDFPEDIAATSGLHDLLKPLRPYATSIIDLNSRWDPALEITFAPYSACTLLQALREAVVAGGVPRKIIVDNGSDYISDAFKRACAKLGIQIEYAQPRDPNKKAIKERFFRKLNEFIHTLPGSTFSNPQDRGDYDSKARALLTISQLRQRINNEWRVIYRDTVHEVTGRAPSALWKEGCEASPPITRTREEVDPIIRVPHVRTIVKGRVQVGELEWFSHALAQREHEIRARKRDPQVLVFVDESDLGMVYVEFDDKTFVQARAVKPLYATGLSKFEHDLIRKEIADAGKRDLARFSDFELERRRYQLRRRIAEDARETRRKLRALARLAAAEEKGKSRTASLLDVIDGLPKTVNGQAAVSPGVRAHTESPALPAPQATNPRPSDQANTDSVALLPVFHLSHQHSEVSHDQ